jgi:hypothetical protein
MRVKIRILVYMIMAPLDLSTYQIALCYNPQDYNTNLLHHITLVPHCTYNRVYCYFYILFV